MAEHEEEDGDEDEGGQGVDEEELPPRVLFLFEKFVGDGFFFEEVLNVGVQGADGFKFFVNRAGFFIGDDALFCKGSGDFVALHLYGFDLSIAHRLSELAVFKRGGDLVSTRGVEEEYGNESQAEDQKKDSGEIKFHLVFQIKKVVEVATGGNAKGEWNISCCDALLRVEGAKNARLL